VSASAAYRRVVKYDCVLNGSHHHEIRTTLITLFENAHTPHTPIRFPACRSTFFKFVTPSFSGQRGGNSRPWRVASQKIRGNSSRKLRAVWVLPLSIFDLPTNYKTPLCQGCSSPDIFPTVL